MNCKQGDIAVFVRSRAGNEGRIVQCVRPAFPDERNAAHMNDPNRFCWLIDQRVPSFLGFLVNVTYDDLMRPIRDQPGEDETLTWQPVPSEVTA